MDKDLINAYVHSNLHEALLAVMYAEFIAQQPDPRHTLQKLRNSVTEYLQIAVFPREDENSPKIQQSALESVASFFQAVEDILVTKGDLESQV